MLRLSKLTDYGIVLLARMAADAPGTLFSARTLAEATGLPAPTVEKILKQMLREDLLQSKRGANGGYRLAHAPEELTLATVIVLLQGTIALTECTDSSNNICEVVQCCGVRDHWPIINAAVRTALNAVTMRDLAQNGEDSLAISSLRSGVYPTPDV